MSAQKRKVKKGTQPTIDEPAYYQKLFWVIPALTLIVLLPLFGHEFINYDDDWMIYDNKFLTVINWESIKAIFSTFYYGQYSPVATIITGIFYHLGPGGVVPLKAGAIIIHLLNVMMVYTVFRHLLGSYRVAVIASMLFAVHPVQMETVAWLSASYKIGLFTLFTLLGIYFWIRHLDTRKVYFLAGSFFTMVLACFSKEQALIFPLFILLVAWYKGEKVFSPAMVMKLGLFAIVSLIFVYVSFQAVASRSEVRALEYSMGERIFFLSYSFVSYLRLLLFPVRLAPFYGFPTPDAISYLFYPVVSFVILFLAWLAVKKDKRVLLTFAFLMATLLLTFALQVVSLRDTLYADRYLYMGVPAFFAGFVLAVENLLKKRLDIPLLIVALIFTGLSLQRATVFKNSETIWSDAISKKYNNPLAYNNRGHHYRRSNQIDKALADYNEALKINPNYYLSLNNRGKIYFDRGQIDLAMEDYNKCLKIAPEFVSALSNRGAALAAKGDYQAALVDLDKAIRLDPENYTAISNRALTWYSMNEHEKAVADIGLYLHIKPDDGDMINLRALCYSHLGRETEALADFNKAIELMPDQGVFYQNRSFYFNRAGNKVMALRDIRKALELGVKVNPAYIQALETVN